LDRIELIVNGQVERVIDPENSPAVRGGYTSRIDTTVGRVESFWAAVRCFERHPEGRVRFAHTNPAYLDVEGKPIRPRKAEVAYFIQRMHEEIDDSRGVLSAEAIDEYEQALNAYEEIAETAQ